MEDNTFDKLKSMLNNGNIPDELKNIVSNMSKNTSANNNTSNSSSNANNAISYEFINNLISTLNKRF